MKRFIDDDFLLETATAHVLYHDHAATLPIIDYHNHLPPAEIASDKCFRSISEIWLAGDHYKWRAMRANGVDERICSGAASDREKFHAWAETMEHLMLNPLFHWTQLELLRVFGIQDILRPENADDIYERCNALLAGDDYSTRSLLKRFHVEALCTTDDPADTLEHHRQVQTEGFEVAVFPTYRADRASAIESPSTFAEYIKRLGERADVDITTPASLLGALRKRHDAFADVGCRVSDHGETMLYVETYTDAEITKIFCNVLKGSEPDILDIRRFKSWLLYELAIMDHEKGWVQQFHLGALRNPNTRLFQNVGADAGGDAMGAFEVVQSTAKFLNRLESNGTLAKTILYNINPRDNEAFSSLVGSFNDGSLPGRIQHGTAWWFMDQLDGMERQMTSLASIGLLSRFVGMVTDSRSFLSFPRHEYFRRLLCNMIGKQADRGLLPRDEAWLGGLVRRVCYENARSYFDFHTASSTTS